MAATARLARLEARDSRPPPNRRRSPRDARPACELFSAGGYVQEALLTDYVLQREKIDARELGFVIPVTVDDLAANGLLGEAPPSPSASARQVQPPVCWERSVETLTARKDDITGLAVASEEQIEACILYTNNREIVLLRSFVDDGGVRLPQLLSRLGTGTFRFPKVHPAEISTEWLETLGFRPAGGHLLYAATLRQRSGSP